MTSPFHDIKVRIQKEVEILQKQLAVYTELDTLFNTKYTPPVIDGEEEYEMVEAYKDPVKVVRLIIEGMQLDREKDGEPRLRIISNEEGLKLMPLEKRYTVVLQENEQKEIQSNEKNSGGTTPETPVTEKE